MEIIKVVTKERNFTVMDNGFLRDGSLSLKAKGLLAMILSFDAKFNFSIEGLLGLVTEGKAAIYAAINELKKAGYCSVSTVRDGKKIVRWEYRFAEARELLPDFQEIENQEQGFQEIENPTQRNTNNKEILKGRNTNTPYNPPKRKSKDEDKKEYAAGVRLTEMEYGRLCDEYGRERTDAAISYLSSYKREKDYKTKDDNLTLRRWVFKAVDRDAMETQKLGGAKKRSKMDDLQDTFDKIDSMFNGIQFTNIDEQ